MAITGAIFNSLIYGGVDSADYGVYITGDAVFNAPKRSVELVSVPGRNGAIEIDQGHFENIEVSYPAGMFGDDQTDFRERLSDFRNAIMSQKGYQRLSDTYHPDEFRMGIYVDGLEVEPKHYNEAGQFTLRFNCKPQRWLTSGEEPIDVMEWGETETLSGEIVTFEAEDETIGIKSVTANITPIQDLHGYTKPWAGGNGKNLLPMTVDGIKAVNTGGTWSGNAYTVNGVTFKLNTDADGNIADIVVNGSVPGNTSVNLYFPYFHAISGIQYTISGSPSGKSNTTYRLWVQGDSFPAGNRLSDDQESRTTATASATADNECFIQIFSGATYSNLVFYPMIRLASASADFEPYSNICPITGWSDVKISRPAKNLFDKTDVELGAYNTTTGEPVDTNTYRRSVHKIIAEPNTEYVISGFQGSDNRVFFYKANGDYISYVANVSSTFTTPNNCAFMQIRFPSQDPLTYAQIEKGSAATTYEAFDSYTISLGGTRYGGTIDVTSGVMTVDRASVNLSSLPWTDYTQASLGSYFYADVEALGVKFEGPFTTPYHAKSSAYFIGARTPSLFVDGSFCFDGNQSQGRVIQLQVIDHRYADANEFSTALSNNDVQVVYELATPLTVQLTPTQIEALIGINNIWADTGNVTVEYGQAPGYIVNPTLFDARPLLEVDGEGTININSYAVSLNDIVLGPTILINAGDGEAPLTLEFNPAAVNAGDPITIDAVSVQYISALLSTDPNGHIDSESGYADADSSVHKVLFYLTYYKYTVRTVLNNISFTVGTASTIQHTVNFAIDDETSAYDIFIKYDGNNSIQIYAEKNGEALTNNAPVVYMDVKAVSSVSVLGDPTYIDCEIGEAYMIKDGSIISLNQFIDLGSRLPVLNPGVNKIVCDDTITAASVHPRWWKV